MADSADTLMAHLNQVPQPLRGVIRQHLAKDSLRVGLGDLSTKHQLSPVQIEAVLLECLMVICHVTSLEELKDSLIAEAEVSCEAAVRIQRTFETEVLLTIAKEAEALGYREEIEWASRSI